MIRQVTERTPLCGFEPVDERLRILAEFLGRNFAQAVQNWRIAVVPGQIPGRRNVQRGAIGHGQDLLDNADILLVQRNLFFKPGDGPGKVVALFQQILDDRVDEPRTVVDFGKAEILRARQWHGIALASPANPA